MVAGAAIAVPTFVSSSALGLGGAVAPSDRIVLGGLGTVSYTHLTLPTKA